MLVVEPVIRLQREEDNRHVELTHERRKGRTRRVSDHVNEEYIEVGRLHRRDHRLRGNRIVRHAEARDLHLMRLALPDENILLLHHVVQKSGTLLPIRVEANRNNTDIRRQRLATFNAQLRGKTVCKRNDETADK